MRRSVRQRLAGTMAASVLMMTLMPHIVAIQDLPEKLTLHSGTVAEIPMSIAVSAGVDAPERVISEMERTSGENIGRLKLTAGETGKTQLTFRLLGLIPVRSVEVTVEPERRLIPGGQSIGVAINTQGLMVVGASDLGQTPSPARLAGLKSGDIICSIDGETISGAEELSQRLTDGKTSSFEIMRKEETFTCEITPVQDERDGVYRLGLWVRDSTAGVGTMTYYDPTVQEFGALGHAIADVDTGEIMPVGEGEIYENSIVDITRSEEGSPGELIGDFFGKNRSLGEVTGNSSFGIFGKADTPFVNLLYPDGLPVASRNEIKEGAATLLTTLDDSGVKEYTCEIVSVSDKQRATSRSMVIQITDDELIEKTGGIVQGMSGSPILQDGKIVGAVTHVLVNDPTRGYGIFIENMLDAVG